jgi:hypothetical protein
MRRIWTLAGSVAAAFTLMGISGVASAAEYPLTGLPELGRCVKVGTGGAYKYKSCVITAPGHNGAFEWQPGPGAKPKFEASVIQEADLETVGKKRVHCGPSEIIGEWLDGKKASVNVFFHGCQEPATKKTCTTPEVGPQKESEIKTTEPLEGEIGFISGKGGTKPKVGIDLKSKSALPMLTFTCGGPPAEPSGEPVSWTVEGSVIGEVKPIDAMKTEGKAVFRAVAGKQVPEKFEEGVTDVPIAKYGTPLPSTTEEAGLTLREEHKTIATEYEEPLEIKAK